MSLPHRSFQDVSLAALRFALQAAPELQCLERYSRACGLLHHEFPLNGGE